jgi:hypothetical protein
MDPAKDEHGPPMPEFPEPLDDPPELIAEQKQNREEQSKALGKF